MTYHTPARPTAHRTRLTILVASVIGAILIGAAASPIAMLHSDPEAAVIGIAPSLPPLEERGPHDERRDPQDPAILLSEADGAVPASVTVFNDAIPAVAHLDPALLSALRRAATDAANDGVEFYVSSGWRSPTYQEQLLRDAISTYGSEAEAARWVATAETSAHVLGEAVDIGPFAAIAWLSEHGAAYGLCQIYSNEPWHYELRPEAIDHGCPPPYADPTHDPRMQP